MTYRISIRSWFFLLHNRFPEANVLERYISFADCLSLLKQNKRTGACKPFKSAVTNRFLKKQTWPFQFGSRSKKSRSLTRTAALCIWRAPLGFAVVFGAQPRPFRRRHRKLFTRPFSSQLFACRVNGIVFMQRKWRTLSHLREPIRSQKTQRCSFRPIVLLRPKSMERNSNAHFSTRNCERKSPVTSVSSMYATLNVVVLRKFFWALY